VRNLPSSTLAANVTPAVPEYALKFVQGSLEASTLRGLYGIEPVGQATAGAWQTVRFLGGLANTYRVKPKDSGGRLTWQSRFPEKEEHTADFGLMLSGLKSVFEELNFNPGKR
jgi:hypothetical protein